MKKVVTTFSKEAPVLNVAEIAYGESAEYSFSNMFLGVIISPIANESFVFDFKNMRIKDYELPREMTDLVIWENSGLRPVSRTRLMILVCSLVVNPEIGLQYFGYQLDKKVRYCSYVELEDLTMVMADIEYKNDKFVHTLRKFNKNDKTYPPGTTLLAVA